MRQNTVLPMSLPGNCSFDLGDNAPQVSGVQGYQSGAL